MHSSWHERERNQRAFAQLPKLCGIPPRQRRSGPPGPPARFITRDGEAVFGMPNCHIAGGPGGPPYGVSLLACVGGAMKMPCGPTLRRAFRTYASPLTMRS